MEYTEEEPLPEMREADEQGPNSPMHTIRSYIVESASDDDGGYDTSVGSESDLDFSSDDALMHEDFQGNDAVQSGSSRPERSAESASAFFGLR